MNQLSAQLLVIGSSPTPPCPHSVPMHSSVMTSPPQGIQLSSVASPAPSICPALVPHSPGPTGQRGSGVSVHRFVQLGSECKGLSVPGEGLALTLSLWGWGWCGERSEPFSSCFLRYGLGLDASSTYPIACSHLRRCILSCAFI